MQKQVRQLQQRLYHRTRPDTRSLLKKRGRRVFRHEDAAIGNVRSQNPDTLQKEISASVALAQFACRQSIEAKQLCK
jgi:hypothetical protein